MSLEATERELSFALSEPRRRRQASSSNDADIPRDPSLRSRMTARDIGEVKDLGVDRSRMTTRKNCAAKDLGANYY
ncbi:MAG: hypothetical protein IJY18_02095 [Clostridia bacterium]|nr:hypothetical protein [Clostridia bacterium]